jgi:hypothetical protein
MRFFTALERSYGRPESRSLLRSPQSNGSACNSDARVRIRCNAARTFEESIRGEPGTSRAIGTPRRVILTVSPRSTRSSRTLRMFLASETPTVIIAFFMHHLA